MADKARFAFGSKSGVEAAIQRGDVDAFDFLCLNGENENPSLGWVDKNGNPVYVECEKKVEVVDSLPETGDEGIIYVFKGKGYVWYEEAFVSIAESVDLTTLESQVADLETQMEQKVDAPTVESMIKTAVAESNGIEVVEF